MPRSTLPGVRATATPARDGLIFGRKHAAAVEAALRDKVHEGNRQPMTQFSGDELGHALPINTLIKRARAYAHAHFDGKTITNRVDGTQIIRRGIKHSLSGRISRAAAIASTKLDQLLERGEPSKSEPDKKRRNTILAVHTYDAPIRIGSRPALIRMIVRQASDGHRFYDHHALIEKNPAGRSGKPNVSDSARPFTGSSEESIAPQRFALRSKRLGSKPKACRRARGLIFEKPYATPHGRRRRNITLDENAVVLSLDRHGKPFTPEPRAQHGRSVPVTTLADGPFGVAPEALWRTTNAYYTDHIQGTREADARIDGEIMFSGEGRKKALFKGRRDIAQFVHAVAPLDEVNGKLYAVRLTLKTLRGEANKPRFCDFRGFD